MPPPHLLPSEADLLRCGYIFIVAALTAGMGFLAGARRLETAFFAGWGLACLIFVAAGTWFRIDLGLAAGAAALTGACGLVRRLLSRPIERDRIGLRMLVVGAPFVLMVLGMCDIAWDDFAFWVPNLLHLCSTHRFPDLAEPAGASAMPGYPYALALPGFAVHLLGGTGVDTVAFVWNLLAMLAAGAAFANILARRIRTATARPLGSVTLWLVVTLGFWLQGMANPAFIAKITLSNMGDSASGAGLALLCALLFEWNAEARDAAARGSILREISLTGCATIFIRQENLALVGMLLLSALAGMALFQTRGRARDAARLGAAMVLPLVIWWSWKRYEAIEIPHGSHYVLPLQEWHWSLFGSTLAAASHVLATKPGYAAMAVTMIFIAVRMILRRLRDRGPPSGECDPAPPIVATAVAGLVVGNIAFLLFCYLATSFDPDEAASAISFWRFIGQTGQALMVGFACLVPIRWLDPKFRSAAVLRIVPLAGMLLPAALFPGYRDDLTSPVPRLRMIAGDIDRVLAAGKPIVLMDLSGNGFAALVVKYQMAVIEGDGRPIRVIAEPHGIPPAAAAGLVLPADTYVWLAGGSPDAGAIFGGEPIAGRSYLFIRESGTFHLLKDWTNAPLQAAWRMP